MAITQRARKLLWGRAANRCAICKRELVVDATPVDQEALVGEECHIISARPGGPRHNPSLAPSDADSYQNLILLCRVHHRMVDEQSETYNTDALRGIKAAHEHWVSESLQSVAHVAHTRLRWHRKSPPEHLVRLTTGRELLNLILGSHGSSLDHDELRTEQEVELVGDFLQVARDYGEAGEDLEPYQLVRISVELTHAIQELEEAGFFVFGGREVRVLEGGIAGPADFVVSILRVLRQTNDVIIKVDFCDKVQDGEKPEEHSEG